MITLNLFKPKAAPRAQAVRIFSKELMIPERDWSEYDTPTWSRVGESKAIIDAIISNETNPEVPESFEQRKQRLLNNGESLRSFVAPVVVTPVQLPAVPAIEQDETIHTGEFIERDSTEDDSFDSIAGWITGVVQYMAYQPYKFRKGQNTNYVVRLSNRDVWGIELQHALSDANVKVGDKIAVKKVRYTPVTVQQATTDGNGNVLGVKDVKTRLNHWIVRVISVGV